MTVIGIVKPVAPLFLTLDDEFAALCGYTQEELEHCFAAHIERMPDGPCKK